MKRVEWVLQSTEVGRNDYGVVCMHAVMFLTITDPTSPQTESYAVTDANSFLKLNDIQFLEAISVLLLQTLLIT